MKYGVAGLSLIIFFCPVLIGAESVTRTPNWNLDSNNFTETAPSSGWAGPQSWNRREEMIVAQAQQPSGESAAPAAGNADKNSKGAGAAHDTPKTTQRVLKIGVTQVSSSADQSLSVEGMQQELANDINFLGGKAVILAADPNDRDAANDQAKQQGCDYVILTNIISFKTASVGQKLGSVLNRGGLGGVGGTGHGRVEMTANVKIFQPDVFTPILDGTNDFRGNDVESTVKGLMHTEARTVMLELKKPQPAKEAQ